MSKLLDLTNRLKAQATRNMLTPTQQAVFTELERRCRFPDRINLCGPQGSGKTFLGWVIARYLKAHFYSSPRIMERSQPPFPLDIIVDNAPSEEKNLRNLLAELQLRQIRRVLLITSQPIRLGFPAINLPPPTSEDIQTIYTHLDRLHFYSTPVSVEDTTINNLWTIMHSVL